MPSSGFNRFYANDETFCFSTAKADARLTMASLSEIMPDWVQRAQLATDPDMLLDLVVDRQDRGIYHPVRTRDSFIASLADRIANTGFLSAMRPSLARLTPENEAEVLRQAGRKFLRIFMKSASERAENAQDFKSPSQAGRRGQADPQGC